MRRGRIAAGALVAALVLGRGAPEARAWGYIAHRLVVEDAAAAVPEPLRSFFASRTGRLSDLSLEPDTVLKPADSEEGSHHFFNLDLLVENPTLARDMPGDLEAARRRYGTERLARAGILPWWIADRTAALARAMRDGDGEAVLVLSGHLSHYAADLHQPLHLTRNFDGLETHNDGIHMAFERFLIEKRRDAFRPSTRDGEPPRPITDASHEGTWKSEVARWALGRTAEVFPSAREVLSADTAAVLAVRKEGSDYYRELDRRAGPLARRLLAQSSRATAALWLTAWIEAGRPQPSSWRAAPPRGRE